MKLAQHKNNLLSNAQTETNHFSIGDASIIIDILRNRLYEHKVRTLVQEYLCNARDAHREINNTKPFEVTIPNQGSLMFKVRDFGPGISPDRIANVFVKYGNSTKRNDNGQTGGFGIGAKSAWAYTDSFNVITYIDHVKRVYIAHTGSNNTGSLDLVSTEITNEPNGTEISFAVKSTDITEFTQAIYRCVYFWDTKPIFKGTLETPNFDALDIDGLKLIQQNDIFREKRYVLVDSVPYELPSEIRYDNDVSDLFNQFRSSSAVFIPVKTGEVEVSASRESITNIPDNLQFLLGVCKAYAGKVSFHVAKQIAKATPLGAIEAFKSVYKQGFETSNLKTEFTEWVVQGNEITHREKNVFKRSNSNYDDRRYVFTTPLYYLDKPMNNAQIKRRKDTLKTNFYWLEDHTLVSTLGAIPFSSVAETMPAKTVSVKKETITVRNLSRYGKQEKDISSFDATTDIYLTEEELATYLNIEQYVTDKTFFVVAKSNLAKVKKTGCLYIETWYKTFVPTQDMIKEMTKSVLSNYDVMKTLDSTKDSFLNAMLDVYENNKLTYDKWGDTNRLPECRAFRSIPEIAAIISLDEQLTSLIDTKYPLLRKGDASVKNELIIYINAKN